MDYNLQTKLIQKFCSFTGQTVRRRKGKSLTISLIAGLIKHRLIIFHACPNLGSIAESSGGRMWSHGQTALCIIIYSYIYFLRGYLQWREDTTGDDWLWWDWIPSIYVLAPPTNFSCSQQHMLRKYYASCDWWIAPEVICKWPDTTTFKLSILWFLNFALALSDGIQTNPNKPHQQVKTSKVQPY